MAIPFIEIIFTSRKKYSTNISIPLKYLSRSLSAHFVKHFFLISEHWVRYFFLLLHFLTYLFWNKYRFCTDSIFFETSLLFTFFISKDCTIRSIRTLPYAFQLLRQVLTLNFHTFLFDVMDAWFPLHLLFCKMMRIWTPFYTSLVNKVVSLCFLSDCLSTFGGRFLLSFRRQQKFRKKMFKQC